MRTATPANPLRCFGWSARAWARPWRALERDWGAEGQPRVACALELGAGVQSSLAPLLLPWADRVECSAHDAATLPTIRARNDGLLDTADAARIRYSQQDLRALDGRWDLIVLKSVLGGVHRVSTSSLSDVHATIDGLIHQHLTPGGWLVSLDNGRTALEPLLARFGARRNGWRFFGAAELAPATIQHRFGVLGSFSAATRLGALGQGIDDGVYALDCLLTPLARQHAVHLHAWRRPA